MTGELYRAASAAAPLTGVRCRTPESTVAPVRLMAWKYKSSPSISMQHEVPILIESLVEKAACSPRGTPETEFE